MPPEAFPPKPPAACKVGVRHALKKGTWVTGRNLTGLNGIVAHKGHIIVIDGKPNKLDKEARWLNSGYAQPVSCLECAEDIGTVDGEFLQDPVDEDYLQAALIRIKRVIKNHQAARISIIARMGG